MAENFFLPLFVYATSAYICDSTWMDSKEVLQNNRRVIEEERKAAIVG